MRICFLNQAPQRSAGYETKKIEALLNSYASPGTRVEIVFPDDYEGAQLYETIGAQSILNGVHPLVDPPARGLRQGHPAAEERDFRDRYEAHPRLDRRDSRGDHPAARRRAHSLRGRSGRPRQGDRRASAQYQGDWDSLCRNVRALRDDA